MNKEISSNIIEYNSYDLNYWKDFFLKKEENKINSVEIKSNDSLQLYNVKINKKIYDGIIKFDSYKCPHFFKNFSIYKNGKTYIGDFKERKLTGYGEILSKNFYYKGYIYNGKKNKKGKYIFKGKLMYIGYWRNNKRNKYGILKFLNEKKKLIYKGYWKNDKRNFYGIQHYNNNSIYNGFWEENKKCGLGKIIWFANLKNNISKYINEYENVNLKKNKVEKKTNYNLYIHEYKKKNIVENLYVGEWMNDKQHGFGIYIWFKKKKNKNKIIYQNENYDKYAGYWNKGKKDGYGIFYYNNGNKYIGIWKNNKKNGYGYLIKANGIIFKCLYKNNELISEKQLNKTYKINNIYTNSLCNVIDLFFFKKIYNITNKNIEIFYKIIYRNFEFLVEIYDYYKKRNGKKKKNKSHNFKLFDLWKMFYRSKIINTEFTLNSLNNLVIDYSLLIEENELFNFFDVNNNLEFSFNEKDIIESFFKSVDYLNIFSHNNIINNKNSFIYKNSIKTNEKKKNQKNVNLFNYYNNDVNEEYNSINTNNNINVDKTNINNDVDNENFVICDENYLNKNSSYLKEKNWNNLKNIFNLFKNIIFNNNLLCLKDCTNFNKYHHRHCCHKNENNFILKKIYFSILKSKRENNKNYLYYALVSVFQCVPLLHHIFNIAKKCNYSYSNDINVLNFYYNKEFNYNQKNGLKKNNNYSKTNNLKKNIHPLHFYEIIENKDCITYLKKLITFINLNRYYLHDENRKISFNSFISTLIHISIRFDNLNNINETLRNLINSLKRYSQKRELPNSYLLRKKEKEGKINKNHFNKIISSNKYKKKLVLDINDKKELIYLKNDIDENKKEKIKYDNQNLKERNKKSQEKSTICSICNEILNKNCKKKNYKKKNYKKKNYKKKNYKKKNCKYCLKRKLYSLCGKKCDKELINILKNFIYYFMFYFLIFESKDKKISIFSIKLNISIRLRDIILFLIKLKLLKMNRNENKVKYANLNYFLFYKKRKKKKKKKSILLNEIDYKDNLLDCKMKNKNSSKTFNKKKNPNNIIINSKEKKNAKCKNIEKNSNNLVIERNTKNMHCDKIIDNENNVNENRKDKNKKNKTDNCKINKSEVKKNNINKNENNENNENNKNEYNENEINYTKNICQKEKNNKKEFCKKKKSVGRVKKLIFKSFSKMFYLSFSEILSIFSSIFNSKNMKLVNELSVDLYLSKLKKKKRKNKINKYSLKNNIIHYFMILKEKREINSLNNSDKTNYKVYNKLSKNHKKINKEYMYTLSARNSERNINIKNSKWSSLGKLNCDPIFKNENILNTIGILNSENIKNRNGMETNEEYLKKKTYLMQNQHYKLIRDKQTLKNAYIKRKNEIKKKLYRLRKYIFSHKNYISILDYFNIYITPYELLLFFLKFVKIIKKKRKIKNSYNDTLYFFIFHILLYKSSILANNNKKY
ncbi:conserved Plasmodium protein, unknown function [Plasmodium gallinaceum]|uniref:MORN repeat protein n=1 Tax=Plasmodium gallinaceum TaxID=5849 RepID=A0A1J1H361_PLAGA|nr:conserved Plasmodium protein, unknown function [Plasmodium gallinaceum]CRG97925.1 conserved Plasmodium protein, unknown function [Plasmodium gallinaceum]